MTFRMDRIDRMQSPSDEIPVRTVGAVRTCSSAGLAVRAEPPRAPRVRSRGRDCIVSILAVLVISVSRESFALSTPDRFAAQKGGSHRRVQVIEDGVSLHPHENDEFRVAIA